MPCFGMRRIAKGPGAPHRESTGRAAATGKTYRVDDLTQLLIGHDLPQVDVAAYQALSGSA